MAPAMIDLNTNQGSTTMNAFRILTGAGLCAALALIPSDAAAGRFGGGGGGGRGGGGGFGGGRPAGGGYGGGVQMARPAGGFGGAPMARPAGGATFHPNPVQGGSVHGPYGGVASGARQTGTVTGAGGGYGTVGRQAGAYTGPRGAQAVGGSRGGSYTTAGGATVIAGGKGGTVTGPGGNTVSGGKAGAVVIGPNGNVHATGGKGAVATGPNGTVAAGSHGSITSGPNGVVASGGRGAVATGANGTWAGGSRGAVAVGPNGAVASGSRGAIATGPGGTYYHGTRYVGATNLHGQGTYVRSNFHYYNAFTPSWYNRYPGAWFAAGAVAGAAWAAPAWGACASSVGYAESAPPYIYDYGDNITYQDGSVYYGDQPAATEAQYADQASQFAAAGQQADPGPAAVWQPLGVFAMVKGDETTSNDIFQLAMDKNGVVRGNYYNAVSDAVTPVAGSLDKTSQRVAWTIGDKKFPVYEAGLYNLTQDQTTMLVHFDKDQTEQYRLFRVEQPKDGATDATK
jgi:hypothetical protein